MTWTEPHWKPSRTARKRDELTTKRARARRELLAKEAVRRRDRRVCRFPLCGCRKLKLPLEVAHLEHKGMGGNPAGERSEAGKMILLCSHRHQFGGVSLHKGTLEVLLLDERGADGPVAWRVNGVIVAVETVPGWIDACEPLHRAALEELARMED